ncbi:tetratricopeptide repeat protein [Vibrio agarivorans]|uniref:Tetratricopeptide repeat protein n=1 Tax=Vibrio agarivorans TaxID=153622 RepID=A0ABT7XXN7_9VIBR|nr:tetratricopeptide repeat protein [Vibrio agarivorans]MDN2480543.1 tetratricopeptide repeat protein [Vibrio agarivorans]
MKLLMTFMLLMSCSIVWAQSNDNANNIVVISHKTAGYESSLNLDINDPNVILHIDTSDHNGDEDDEDTPSITGDINKAVELSNSAQSLAEGENFTQALEALESALEHAPNMAETHALKGSVLFKLGDSAGARQAWKRSLELNPNQPDVKDILAWVGE